MRGRAFKPLASGAPSRLKDTGAMLRSFGTASTRPTGFTLGPSGKRERRKAAAAQFGLFGLPVRRWIGLSRRAIDQAAERVATAWKGTS